MFLKWSGSSSSSDGFFSGRRQLSQQIPKVFTAEGASIYLRRPQLPYEKQKAFEVEDPSIYIRSLPL